MLKTIERDGRTFSVLRRDQTTGRRMLFHLGGQAAALVNSCGVLLRTTARLVSATSLHTDTVVRSAMSAYDPSLSARPNVQGREGDFIAF